MGIVTNVEVKTVSDGEVKQIPVYELPLPIKNPYPVSALAKFRPLEITLSEKQIKTLQEKRKVILQRNGQKLTVTLN